MSSTRRELLARTGTAVVGAALLGPRPGYARYLSRGLAREGTFVQGVASGVPSARGVTLWTRLDGAEGRSFVELEVARDPDFRRVVHRERVVARPATDHTVKVRAHGRRFEPDEQYFYRFENAAGASEVGRFKTLPALDSRRPLRIGLWTCQDYRVGHYASHASLAADEDLDLVVCLGDYVYETGGTSSLAGRDDSTGGPDGVAQTLDEYRAKYRLYRSDADLRALHANHAWVMLWDDHEVVNNYWREGAAAKTIEGFAERRGAAYKAWFEHQPVPRIGKRTTRIYRTLRIGKLGQLFVVDDRQYRDAQPCGDSNLVPCPEASTPGRTMLGGRQKDWLKDRMRSSEAQWKALLNGDMLMGLDQPSPGSPKFVDTWDGYVAEREELVSFWLSERIEDVIVMTGDDHDNYAGVLTTTGKTGGTPGAVEFVVPSVTSDNTSELIGPAPGLGQVSEANTRAVNTHLQLVDQRNHGHCVLELGPESAEVTFRHIADRADPRSPTTDAYRFLVPRGSPRLEQTL